MKKINEQELVARSIALREKLAEQMQTDEGIAGAAWNAVKGAGSAIANGAQKVLGSTAGKVGLGAAAGAGALAAGQQLAGGAAPAAAGTTKPAGGKPDPAIMKQQQDLIAKGAKIKADGIMGPATQAAITQFGGAAPAAPAEPAAPGAEAPVDTTDPLAANNAQSTGAAPAAPAAPAQTFAQNVAANKAAAQPGGAPAAAQPGLPASVPGSVAQLSQMAQQGLQTGQPASTDDLMKQAQAALAAKQAKPAAAPAGAAVQGQMAAESVGFQNEELSRIISLVHHR